MTHSNIGLMPCDLGLGWTLVSGSVRATTWDVFLEAGSIKSNEHEEGPNNLCFFFLEKIYGNVSKKHTDNRTVINRTDNRTDNRLGKHSESPWSHRCLCQGPAVRRDCPMTWRYPFARCWGMSFIEYSCFIHAILYQHHHLALFFYIIHRNEIYGGFLR